MAINVQRIPLTDEKLHFLHYSVQEVMHELIDVLGHFSVILQPKNFVKLNLPIFLVLVDSEKNHKTALIFRLLTRI